MKSAVKLVIIMVVVLFASASFICNGRQTETEEAGEVQAEQPAATDKYAEAREKMVTRTIERRGVKDKEVLAAMRKAPRHEFVPKGMQSFAYLDRPLPIGLDQTISQPYIVAFMTEALELSPGERVLEIGTGSGYQAAVLAEITDNVYSIEILCDLADRAEATLERLGYDQVVIKCGDGYQGWREHAPFDAIIVTAAPDHVPEPLVEQLAIGGVMVIPVGKNTQELIKIKRHGKASPRTASSPSASYP